MLVIKSRNDLIAAISLIHGQVGVVKVRIVPGQAAYDGSTKNGITTSAYGPWGGSYEFVK